MRQQSTRFFMGVKHLALAATLLLGSCRSWDVVRVDVVNPLNQLIHRDLPSAFEEMDLEVLGGFYADAIRETAYRDARDLLARFESVEHGECVLEEVTEDGDDLVIDAVLRLDGLDHDGLSLTVTRDLILRCRAKDHGFAIVASETVAEQSWRNGGPTFREEAVARGLDFAQTTAGVLDRNGRPQRYLPGTGLGVGDVDGDGLDDVLLLAGGGRMEFFHNHNGRFIEETAKRGLYLAASGELRTATFGDLDQDGDADLFVGVVGAPDLVFENVGDGHYQSVDLIDLGLTSTGETSGVALADFDGDGDLDVYVASGSNLLLHDPEPIYGALNATRNHLFLNDGDWSFRDVTEESGLEHTGWALCCSTGDWDSDGDVDIILGNDFGLDALYRNNGDATFEDVSDDFGVVHRGSTMGVVFGDVDGNGHVDLLASGMASNSSWMVDMRDFPVPAPFPFNEIFRGPILSTMREMLHGNRLYLNSGNGEFEEVSVASRTRNAGWSWGGLFLDYDNDTRLDAYVVNGLVSNPDADDL